MRPSATIVMALMLAPACTSHDEILEVPTTTGATIVPNEPSIHDLSRARCAWEAACGRVGTNLRFETAGDCASAAELDERSSIGLDACPFGVDQSALLRCADAIRARPCKFPIGTLDNVAECKRTELCW